MNMNGDLSLSQALGGLRIANPDDAVDHQADLLPSSSDHQSLAVDNVAIAAVETSPGRSIPVNTLSNNNSREADQVVATPVSNLEPPTNISSMTIPRRPINSDPILHSQQTAEQITSTPPRPNDPTVAQYISSRGHIGSNANEHWKDRGPPMGIRRDIDPNGRTGDRPVKKEVRDFSFGHVLGEGSYSTVYLATDKHTSKQYAIKVLEKRHIIKEKKIKYVNIEKNTLNRLTQHPGIVHLYYTFQDTASLYYVLDLCTGGELLGVLKKTGTFDVDCARFYGAQILDSVDYMHSRGVIHRDLKPENVLLDDQMHIKITDFGTAKLLPDPRQPNAPTSTTESADVDADGHRAASFVGTAEYVSPELLTHKQACKASDLWAFGCIIYQLLAGRPPFKAGSEYLTFQKIVNLNYEFPQGFPDLARDLVERCLVLDPARRITIEHIKRHPFFEGQEFGRGLWGVQAPTLRAYIPPAQEPSIIQLNGPTSNPSSATTAATQRPPPAPLNGVPRPSRIITELPPPTQLDIEWSPVLTRDNERILKLGDLVVISTPLANNVPGKAPEESHKKLSRFFGGSSTKKRQRLVMVTSSGRLLLAPAGGDEKRAKQEISLLAPHSSWESQRDVKGQLIWRVDAGGYRYTFEDIKGSLTDDGVDSALTWVESLNMAKDLAVSRDFLADNAAKEFSDLPSSMLDSTDTMNRSSNGLDHQDLSERSTRNHLSKSHGGSDDGSFRRNRFSKRQSRNGLDSAF